MSEIQSQSALDQSQIDDITSAMLGVIADMKASEVQGAVNIRKDGHLAARRNSENIVIETKTDVPGIDIKVKPGTIGEQVHIPVVLTETGLNDKVYNDFYIGAGSDVYIVAGCGIHNDGCETSEHDGIHRFFLEKGSKVVYVEKHYGEGSGSGDRILNPRTEVHMGENTQMEMVMVQIEGVTDTVRDTDCYLAEGAKLTITEKLKTSESQKATSNVKIELEGDSSSVQVISRSVAMDDSVQIFAPLVVGKADCRGHVQCDAIIMGNAKVRSVPGIEADSEDAQLVHEAAIGKIAGEQIIKLMTLGLSEEEAEQQILEDFLS
ncbi:MAG: SufD family Fe-S cluster assembly protein [Coriobacteriales bacterium]|nr:SufD family Fe-S cluster assembly protein [Coriobacteriales bacterium]